jgi:hypothetical protein
MVVECGFNMAASNTLSTVNGHAVQRRSGGGGSGGAGQSSSSSSAVLSFQCQSQGDRDREHHQDSARLYSSGNCGDSKQCRAEFLSAKDANRRKRVSCLWLRLA